MSTLKKPSSKTIKSELKKLRKICKANSDPYESRMAQAIEYGILWATKKNAGWAKPHKEHAALAHCLRSDVGDL